MLNPFVEKSQTDIDDVALVERASDGDRAALEALILRHQAWIYNIAARMVFHPHDAEEVTQEVLIKVITKLGTFQANSSFRTWLYRIVANHVLNMKRREAERHTTSFADYGAAINGTPDMDLPDPKSVPVAVPLLVEEAKISCTTGMLLCLDRRQRLTFVLGEILGVTDHVGGEILEITPDNFRQSLARARRDLYSFMNGQCGLVNQSNPCRCAKKTRGFIEHGHVDPDRLLFTAQAVQTIGEAARETVRTIDDVMEPAHAAIYREQPFLEPAKQIEWLKDLLRNDQIRASLKLN